MDQPYNNSRHVGSRQPFAGSPQLKQQPNVSHSTDPQISQKGGICCEKGQGGRERISQKKIFDCALSAGSEPGDIGLHAA
jgi:hypothetical protein